MEIMALPNKETVQFYKEVYPWVKNSFPDEQTPRFIFRKDTPENVLETFEKVKDKIGYDYAN